MANETSTSPTSSPAASVFRPDLARRGIDMPGARPVGAPAPAKVEGPDAKTLIVGREISLNGQINSCDKLVVEGKVEATLTSKFIEIAETGMFKGAAEIEEAEIRGRFEGKLNVRGRLLIRGTGRVSGEIRYAQLEIECGGQISGTVETSTDRVAKLAGAAAE